MTYDLFFGRSDINQLIMSSSDILDLPMVGLAVSAGSSRMPEVSGKMYNSLTHVTWMYSRV